MKSYLYVVLPLLLLAVGKAHSCPSLWVSSRAETSIVTSSNDDDEELLNSRTIQITNYLAGALRLSRPQADSLRTHTRRHLRLLAIDAASAPDSATRHQLPALNRLGQGEPFRQALRRILTKAQYQQLLALEVRQARQPVMVFLAALQ